jgi:hypothetical protein
MPVIVSTKIAKAIRKSIPVIGKKKLISQLKVEEMIFV